jgi:hypothetical protein
MSAYSALLARPGARGLALACAAGWLSFDSYGLAVVLAVAAALAAAVAAARRATLQPSGLRRLTERSA